MEKEVTMRWHYGPPGGGVGPALDGVMGSRQAAGEELAALASAQEAGIPSGRKFYPKFVGGENLPQGI